MSVFYLDYEGGSDAADGLSFANRWKTFTSGATAARIAPGDTIRVMGSPDPTSLGITGAWTNRVGGLAPTQNIVSSTNATPIVVTLTGHGYSNGDTIIITGHTTNTNGGGTWEIANVAANTFELVGSVGNGVGGATGTTRLRNNSVVRLASALTQNIASFANRGEGRVAWTASANVTATLNTTDFKCADVSDSIAVAAGFTTGLAAYFPTGTLDLSSNQQVSFWIKQTAGSLGAGGYTSLTLCSDAAGATPVNTINIPIFGATQQWMPITVDIGGALGASIQSIGFVVNTDNGPQTFLISNILACKASSSADSLTLTSLIGKNTGTETWYGIQSINGTRVMVDRDTNCLPTTNSWRGYSGVTETVTTWKRETIKTVMAISGGIPQEVQDSGTLGNLIAFEGGWDRTNMTVQNLETWFDGQNGLGSGGILFTAKSFVSINLFGLVRYSTALSYSAGSNNNTILTVCGCNNNSIGMSLFGTSGVYGTIIAANNNSSDGVSLQGDNSQITLLGSLRNNGSDGLDMTSDNNSITTINAASNNASNGVILKSDASNNRFGIISDSSGNGSAGFSIQGGSGNNSIGNLASSHNNVTVGVSLFTSFNTFIRSGSMSGNLTSSISISSGEAFLRNVSMSESVEVSGQQDFTNSRIFSEKHDGVADNHQIFTDGGLIRSEGTVRHTASGISWALLPTSANRSANYPLDLSIAKVACKANLLVTFKAWLRRSNTGLTLRLNCKGGQLSGIPNDVTASMTAAADTFEEVTITFTPTEQGVVEILAEAWGGTTFIGYVDDLTITQAS